MLIKNIRQGVLILAQVLGDWTHILLGYSRTFVSSFTTLMTISCNICGTTVFKQSGVQPRPNAQCVKCGSLERHRAMHYFLKARGVLDDCLGVNRCLQLAPEKVTHDYLAKAYGAGYMPADLFPEKYKHAQCVKLKLPEDFLIFPSEYFNLIVHNHVLEHIPGSFRSHIDSFHRLLTRDGVMAFTVPNGHILRNVKETLEGGENLPTDDDRLRMHGQWDHYKTLE
jgi:SAM-dependent methyltransferase